MDINLLSQNLLLAVCSITSVIAAYLLMQLFVIKNRRKDRKLTKKQRAALEQMLQQGGYALAGSLIAAFLLKALFSYLTDSQIPGSFFFMLLPFTISIALLVLIAWLKPQLRVVAGICTILGLLLTLLLVNNYYQFYPTLGELFNQNDNVQDFDAALNRSVLHYTSNSSKTVDKHSLESELYTGSQQSTSGKVYSLNIPGTVSNFKARTAYVYVPAIYSKISDVHLPVIVLTAGFPGLTENWLGSGLEQSMDAFAATHKGITPLVFMVDNTGSLTNDTECVNSPRGNVETYLSTDVPNYIKSHFRVVNSPSNWAIGGLSLGGMCSVMLTLRHPDVYHYFMDYGGESGPEIGSKQQTIDTLFNGSESAWAAHQPTLLLASKNYKNLGIGGFFGDGDQDTPAVTQAISQLTDESQKAGIETVSETVQGSHTFNIWQELFEDSLPWVSNRIQATQCSASCQ
jgi:S-formylglutathione hydrolase FrmB